MKSIFIWLYLFISIYCKNVYDLNRLKAGLESEQSKRDNKKILKFEDLKIGVPVFKRDAKNVASFDHFVQNLALEQNEKRQVVMQDATLLQSILPQYKDISIFAGYVRDNKDINEMTESVDEFLLVISPTDNAIINKLNGVKPWEFPKDLSDGNEDEIVESNLNYFISNHVVLDFSQFKIEDEVVKVKLLSGKDVEITGLNGDISLGVDGKTVKVDVVKQVDNGYIFIIDDTLVKP